MNCPKCNSVLPDDSEFCQYCGLKIKLSIENEKTVRRNDKTLSNVVSPHINFAFTNSINNESIGSSKSFSNQQKEKEPQKRQRLVVPLVIITVLLAGSLFANLYLYFTNHSQIEILESEISNLEKEKANLQKKNNDQEATISSQKTKISSLQSEILSLKTAKTDGSKLYYSLDGFSYGTKYSDYYSSTEVVVVRVGETKTFKITFNVNTQSTVSFQGDNSYSICKWVKNWDNNGSCDVEVTGKTAGTTTYTFTNEYNSHSFKVLVIVLPKK